MRPRIRTVKPELWHDERVVALSRDARLLFIGLMTMADDEGRFRARRSQIRGHVFPGDDDAEARLDEWIGEIRQEGLVVFYIAGETPYGAFRHWRKHQKINRPTPSDLPPPPDPKVVRDNRVPRRRGGTERSRDSHGSFSESAVTSHSSPVVPIRSDPDPDPVLHLCVRLAGLIVANDPKATPNPQSERWRTDMRLLLVDRGGDVAEVEQVMDWSQSDPFWRGNILSPGKLRKQFTALLLRSEERSKKTKGGRPDSLPMDEVTAARWERMQARIEREEAS